MELNENKVEFHAFRYVFGSIDQKLNYNLNNCTNPLNIN